MADISKSTLEPQNGREKQSDHASIFKDSYHLDDPVSKHKSETPRTIAEKTRVSDKDSAILFTPNANNALYEKLEKPPATNSVLKGPERSADGMSAIKDSEALHAFLSEPDKAIKLLNARSDAQRAEIELQYTRLHGEHTLEKDFAQKLSNTQVAEFKSALKRKDGDVSLQNSDLIYTALTEIESDSWSKRSINQIEKDLRDSARTSDPQKLRDAYMRDHGRDITVDVESNYNISDATKKVFQLYMERDSNGPDYAAIGRLAVKAQNLDMFAEAMQCPTARAEFKTETNQELLKESFSRDAQQALDIAQTGKVKTEHQLDKSTGIFGSDTKAVDMSMQLMTPQEVSNYFIGKNRRDRSATLSLEDQARLTSMSLEEQQAAASFYLNVHNHLEGLARSSFGSASKADVLRWEDLAATKNGSIVGELQRHWGRLYSSGSTEIKIDVASMTQKDWADAKAHPERRDQLKRMLLALDKTQEESKPILDVYDQKVAENDWLKADRIGRGDVLLEKLDENWRLVSSNDRQGVITDLMDAAWRDPALREHLQNPNSDEERAFARKFEDHVQKLIGADDYKAIVEPFLNTGSIPLEQCAKWNSNNQQDVKFIIDAIGQASADDKRRLLSTALEDKNFQANILNSLSSNEREVALHVASQTDGVQDEDGLRLALIHAKGSQSVDETINTVGVTDKSRAAYAKKYDSSLDADALNGAKDINQIQRALTSENDMVSKFNQTREEASHTRSGFGDWFASRVYGSAADTQLNDATNLHADLMIAAQKTSNTVSQGDLQKAVDTMQQAVDNNKDAKSAAGEVVRNSVIAVGTVAAVIASGGTASIPLTAAFAGSGAVLNAGTKKLFEGNDYSPTLVQLGQDLAIGGLSGAANVIGPAQFVKVLGFAGAAVKEGVAATLESNLETPGLLTTLKMPASMIFSPTAKEDLTYAATKVMHESLLKGAKKLDTIALTKAVNEAIPVGDNGWTEAEHAAFVLTVTQRLEKNITEQMIKQSQRVFVNTGAIKDGAMVSDVQRLGTRIGLNGLAGAGASGMTSGSEAIVNFDPSRGFGANAQNILGATITGATTGLFFGAAAGEGISGLMLSVKSAPIVDAFPKNTDTQFSTPVQLLHPTVNAMASTQAGTLPKLQKLAPSLGKANNGKALSTNINSWFQTSEQAISNVAKLLPKSVDIKTQVLTDSHLFNGQSIEVRAPRSVRGIDKENDLPVFPKTDSYSSYEEVRRDYDKSRPQFSGVDSIEHIEEAWQQNKGKLSNLIAEKLNEKAMSEATFNSPLKFYTGDHLETAKAILDQAAAYATDYGIIKSIKSVSDQLKSESLYGLYYFAATPDSLANMAAYTARKVGQVQAQIRYFDSHDPIGKELNGGPLVIFGDLSRMSPQQKIAFKEGMTGRNGLDIPKIAVVDTSALERLPTSLDYAKGESAVRQKIDAIIKQTNGLMKENPGLSHAEAVSQAIYGPHNKVIAELNIARGKSEPVLEVKPEAISRDEIFSQSANPENIQKFFESKFGADAGRERVFAAELIAFDAQFPSYGDMIKGMQILKQGLDESARKNNLDPAKDLYLVDIEHAGSSESSMMSLFAAANDIPTEQIVTKRQLDRMGKSLGNRRIVVLDDCIYSGTQLDGDLASRLPPHLYPNVVVGTLATYSQYAKDFYARTLVAAAERQGASKEDAMMLTLKYKYGLGSEQMASLKWSDVWEKFENTGGAKRAIGSNDRDALASLRWQSKSEYVFGDQTGTKQTAQTINERLDSIKSSIQNPNFSRDIVTNEVIFSKNPAYDPVKYPRATYSYRHGIKSLLTGDTQKSGYKNISALLQFPAMDADNRPQWFADFVRMKDATAMGQHYDFSSPSDFTPLLPGRNSAKSALLNSASDTLVASGSNITQPVFKFFDNPLKSGSMPTPAANPGLAHAAAQAAKFEQNKSIFDAPVLGFGHWSVSKEMGATFAKSNGEFHTSTAYDAATKVLPLSQVAHDINAVPTAAKFKNLLNGASVGELPEVFSNSGSPKQALFSQLDDLARALRSLDTNLPPQKKSGLGAIDLKLPEFKIKIGDKTVAVKKVGVGEVAHVYKLTVDGESFAFKVPNDPERMDVHGSFAETGALVYLSSLKTPPKNLAKFYAGNPGLTGGWMMSDFIDKPMPIVASESVSDILAKKGQFLGDNWAANVGPGGVIWDVGGIEPLSLVGATKPKTFKEFADRLFDPDFRIMAGRSLENIGSQKCLKDAMQLILNAVPESKGQVARSIGLLSDPADKFEILMQALQTSGAAGRAAFEMDRLKGEFDGLGRSYINMLYYTALKSPQCRIEAVKQIDKLPEADRYSAFLAAWQYPEARPMAAKSLKSIPNVPLSGEPGALTMRQWASQQILSDPGAKYITFKNNCDLKSYFLSKGLSWVD